MSPTVDSADRHTAVTRAREGWIRRLLDPSRRNNLLYYRNSTIGALDCTACDADVLTELMSGEAIPLQVLLPRADPTKLASRAQQTHKRALRNRGEKGIETLFLTFGMATWHPTDKERPPNAPVILVPMTFDGNGRVGSPFLLRRNGELQINPMLLETLETEKGVHVTPELSEESFAAIEQGDLFDPKPLFTHLARLASRVKGFGVSPRIVLGNFSCHKMVMVKELRDREIELTEHDLVAAMAGDMRVRKALRDTQKLREAMDLDRLPPEKECMVLDADSSQQKAVYSALALQNGVIEGAPGTGKSQTIANLIAALVAERKRVLFVAQKRSATNVVLRRLDQVGLGHLLFDLHGADVSRGRVVKQLAESLCSMREADDDSQIGASRRYMECRTRLNDHAMRLHLLRSPAGMSAYEIQGQLLKLPPKAMASVRWRGTDLIPLYAEKVASVRDLLSEAGSFGGLFLRTDSSPWCGATLSDGTAVLEAIDLAARISVERLPVLRKSLAALISEMNLAAPGSVREASALLSLLNDIADTLGGYSPELFNEDLHALASDLSTSSQARLAIVWTWCRKASYRKAFWRARTLRRGSPPPAGEMYEQIAAAADQSQRWRALAACESPLRVPSGLQQVTDQLAALKTDLNAIGRLLSRHDLDRMPIDEMTRFFQALAADRTTPYRIPRLLAIERAIQHHGAADIIQELRASKPEPELWVGVLERAWLHSCLDRARAEDPALGGFNGRSHDQFVEEFCRLDRQQLKSAAARIRHEHADHAMAILNRHEDQHLLVRREIEKRSGLLPLKQLLALAPEVLQALRPCWVASPLSVSQLIGTDRRYFDVVIVDEGSQLSPEVIVPSLLRAQQVVVAGDPHQLPPPLFSVTGKDEEPRQAARRLIERRESVLDHFSSFLKPWTLDCHYRSKDEALIAFSNRHLYGDRLTTFPMPSRSPCISHVLVRSGSEANGQEAGASREAQQVANLVIDHATAEMSKQAGERETLGVITLGLVHVRRIEAALEEALASRPDLGTFFDHGGLEPVFIKSVEDAQGDERDAIIFSLGFGKDQLRKSSPAGCSLLSPDGERRLNVAITRARRRMTIVSSFTHVDINDGAYRGRGKELLRRYLEYAACQGQRSVDDRQSNLSLSPLEQDIYDALTAKGIPLVHHWGRCRHRVSLAAIHPAHLERCVLAIECDGPSYLGARTARDRDRLRQQQLEALGWQFHRIWCIDWFMRRDEEIARVLRAFEVAVALADRRRHPADGQRLALTQPHENLVDPLHAIELTGDHTGPSSPRPESSDPHRSTRLANLLQ